MASDERNTEELKTVQANRVERELDEEQAAETGQLERVHHRRAERAAYLRDRLAEAERSERE